MTFSFDPARINLALDITPEMFARALGAVVERSPAFGSFGGIEIRTNRFVPEGHVMFAAPTTNGLPRITFLQLVPDHVLEARRAFEWQEVRS